MNTKNDIEKIQDDAIRATAGIVGQATMVWRELMAVTLYEADCYRDHCMPIGWHKIDDERFKQRWRESAQGCFDRFNDALKEKSADDSSSATATTNAAEARQNQKDENAK